MLIILKSIMAGDPPPWALVVAVQQALERSADVYRPSQGDLQSAIKTTADIDVRNVLLLAAAASPGRQA